LVPCLYCCLSPCFLSGQPLSHVSLCSDSNHPIHSFLTCLDRGADDFALLLPRVTQVWASASQVALTTRTSVTTHPFSSPRSFLVEQQPRMAASGGERRQGLGS
jgi:hypothetical protein